MSYSHEPITSTSRANLSIYIYIYIAPGGFEGLRLRPCGIRVVLMCGVANQEVTLDRVSVSTKPTTMFKHMLGYAGHGG